MVENFESSASPTLPKGVGQVRRGFEGFSIFDGQFPIPSSDGRPEWEIHTSRSSATHPVGPDSVLSWEIGSSPPVASQRPGSGTCRGSDDSLPTPANRPPGRGRENLPRAASRGSLGNKIPRRRRTQVQHGGWLSMMKDWPSRKSLMANGAFSPTRVSGCRQTMSRDDVERAIRILRLH